MEILMQSLIVIFTIVLFLAGIIGVFVPVIPSLPLIWVGAFFYGYVTGFAVIDGTLLITLGVIALIGTALDFIANILGAKKYGASRWGIFGAAIGTIAGMFFTPIGMIIGAFVGALLFEYIQNSDTHGALRAGVGTFIGFLFGILLKIVLVFVMIGMFVARLFLTNN